MWPRPVTGTGRAVHLLLANLGPVELLILLVVLGIPLVAVVGLVVWLVRR